MNNVNLNHEEIYGASEEFARLSKLIDDKSMRWLELSELNEGE